MTEEETPYIRARPYRKKIYQVIFVLVGLQSLYLTFDHASNQLKEWPADMTDRAAYCRLETYQSCREGQWFGILKSRLPKPGNTGILKEICADWKDKPDTRGPDSGGMRMIDAADGDMLYLCRMKAPAKIDGAKLAL